MKKLLLTLLSGIFLFNVNAQTYHEDDKEGLRKILRQKGSDGISLIFNGLSESDTLQWNESEDWIDKISASLVWNDSVPKRLVEMSWSKGVNKGLYDMSFFAYLENLNIVLPYGMTGNVKDILLDISDNKKLRSLSAGGVTFLNGGFHVDNKIDSLTLLYTGLPAIYFQNLPLLKYLYMREASIASPFDTEYEFSNNPLLQEVSITTDFATSAYSIINKLDFSANHNLVKLICTGLRLQELYVSDSGSLNYLNCSDNLLTFSKMPVPASYITTYVYSPQSAPEVSGNPVSYSYYKGDVYKTIGIDLKEEHSVGNTTTTYVWRVKNTATGHFDEVVLNGTNGKFTIPQDLSGNVLTCNMNNQAFPHLNQYWSFTVINEPLYHEDDKEGLRKILRQKGEAYTTNELPVQAYTTSVFEMFGLTEADTLTWTENEGWIEKLSWLDWSNAEPKRLNSFSWSEGIVDMNFDLSYFSNITSADILITKYTMPQSYLSFIVDISSNDKLTRLMLANPRFVADEGVIFHPANKIDYVWFPVGYFDGSYLEQLPKLKTLQLNGLATGVFDFSKNPLIERVNVKDNSITKIDASTNHKLKYMDCSYGLLEKLYVSDSAPLDTLICDHNKLRMLEMPYRKFVGQYKSGPQFPIYNSGGVYGQFYDYKGVVYIEDGLDLSAYASLRGVSSSFLFFSYEADEGFYDLTHTDGVFALTSDFVGKRVTCEISNPCIPGVSQSLAFDIASKGITTSIEDIDDIEQISINSKDSKIIVKTQNKGQFYLYNMNGQQTKTDYLNNTTEITVPTSGLYLLKVVLNNGVSKTFKVVVK